jgi:hypothetical protein
MKLRLEWLSIETLNIYIQAAMFLVLKAAM